MSYNREVVGIHGGLTKNIYCTCTFVATIASQRLVCQTVLNVLQPIRDHLTLRWGLWFFGKKIYSDAKPDYSPPLD